MRTPTSITSTIYRSAVYARAGENAAIEVAKVRSLRADLAGGKSSG